MKSKLSEIIDLIGGGTPKTNVAEYWGGDIPWLSVKDFNDDSHYVYSTEKTITEAGLANSSTKLLNVDDIIISARGTVGELAMIPFPMAFNQSCYGIRGKKGKVIQTYLYYLLKDSIRLLKSQTHGSVFDTITRDTFANIYVDLPSLAEQQMIADTLSSLDARIAENRKINHHLEQMAQAIFKSWFVNYEPFADKGFVESELGVIPMGWSIATLDDVCSKITDGSHFSPKDSIDGTYPMLSVRDMDNYGFNYKSCKLISDDDYSTMVANDCVPLVNDILVAKDGSYLKHIFIVNEQRKEAILSSIAIFRPNPKVICPELLLCLLKYPATQQTIKDNFVSGSALPRIVLKDFKKLKLVLPPIEVQLGIIDLLSGIRKQIAENQSQIANLMAIRDSLLPRLMSGELSITDINGAK